MSLRLWVEAEETDDFDIFVAVKKVGVDGELIDFTYANVLEHGPVALGWLRASHRALDHSRSTPTRPWHTHAAEERIPAGTVVPLDVEIWPSGTRFEAGETLRLIVKGCDVYPGAALWRHVDTRNSGTHVVHTGGEHPSVLTIPTLSADSGPVWESPDV